MSSPSDVVEPQRTSAVCNRPREISADRKLFKSSRSRRYRNLPIDPSIPLLPIGHFMSIPNRPGRKSRSNPLDPFPSKSYGDAIIQKSDTTVRLFFQNVHGLSASIGSEDYRFFHEFSPIPPCRHCRTCRNKHMLATSLSKGRLQ